MLLELYLPFLRYCTEILALLPFALLDEPLYLVYAINRVLQVRAGTLEANMKAFLHLLQGDCRMSVPGNGKIPQEPYAQPFHNDIVSADVNRAVEENCAGHPGSNYSAHGDSNLHSMTLGKSCGISEDNLQKIQVEYICNISL